ncbi:MAG: Porphobilinogen deaminase, partial [Myxococcaceae bacterium]|nr:Porphobilinogen deaminase [Myxococcaceae bacterium]
DRPLTEGGGKGLFETEIEEALGDGRADLAVHSMKDEPAQLADGLTIACVPVREDARDVLVTRDGVGLDDLEAFCKVGTSSLRRQAQLRLRRNDIICEPVRGNVETRLRKLDEGHYRAIVLALAGLRRLGLTDRPHRALSVEECVPAVGQGALGLETRADDSRLAALLAPLDHHETRICVEAERAYLARLEGGCQLPIGGHAAFSHGGTRLHMDALVGTPDGTQVISAGNDELIEDQTYEGRLRLAVKLGRDLADRMLGKGAGEMIEQARELARERGWKG